MIPVAIGRKQWGVICCFILILMSVAGAVELPSSLRSRRVIRYYGPLLEKELETAGFKSGNPVFIRIFKEESCLEIWIQEGSRYKLFKRYDICSYGGEGLGPKTKQGDGKAPEGFYFVQPAALNPYSSYHLSFNLGYPNSYDRENGRTGSALMIHGKCVSIGCYAMTDEGINEIYTLVHSALKAGQPFIRVHIFPFRMTKEKLEKYKESPDITFWQNLKAGYDYFEEHKVPPDIGVSDKKYVINA